MWNNPRLRGPMAQALLLLFLGLLISDLAYNTVQNLASRHIVSGWEFLWRKAGFEISFSLIPYSGEQNYARALLVGLLNTLSVSICGIVLATVLGLLIGVMRLSRNWLAARMAALYIEVMRNVPLLLQLFIWYKLVLKPLPDVRDAITWGGMALSNKGLAVPAPEFGQGAWALPAGLAIALAITLILRQWSAARQVATGAHFPLLPVAAGLVIVLPLLCFALAGWPVNFNFPVAGNFGFRGGATLVPEFMALVLALSIYTAAFIAEAVRAGIEAVARGQSEAAVALGFQPSLAMRLIVLPQAMRVIIPPLTNQYLNLTKNSSLAVAIGYPDLVSTGGTIIGQTGQAIEVVLVWMGVYLFLSLLTSAFMNWFNTRNRLVER
ncbi:amino acid ABC transporter permease [Aestuariivirga sp.]|uniref:amino acid ABC transporter permease n=1 Tax=Aestuariivirga sp. TaxID=2650926 RepID=UPI003BA9FDA9